MSRPGSRSRASGDGSQRRTRHRWIGRGQDGQNMVEFALVVPLIVLMLVGIVEFGRGMNAFITLSEAAREGARSGIYASATDTAIRTAVRGQAGATLGQLPDASITISPAEPRVSGNLLSVTVDYAFVPATPIFGTILGGGFLNLRAQAKMRVQ